MHALAVVAMVVPAACGDDEASTPTTTAMLDLPAGLTVFVEYPRYLHAARRLEIGFDNEGDTALTVSGLALRSPLFEPVAPESRTTLVAAGRRRDLQVGLGAPVCPAPIGPSLVELTAEIGGVQHLGMVEVAPEPLERISAQECGSEFVLQQVTVGYAPAFSVTDGEVAATIDVERTTGDEPIAVTAMRGSVLIELRPTTAATPLAALATTDERVSIPVRLRVIRCDPHAVTESKKTFELAIWVAVGEREPQRLVVALEGDLRAALQALIEECVREETG